MEVGIDDYGDKEDRQRLTFDSKRLSVVFREGSTQESVPKNGKFLEMIFQSRTSFLPKYYGGNDGNSTMYT